MRHGLLLDELDATIDGLRAQARDAAGYEALWLAQRGGWDALTALAAVGAAAPGPRLGTSVVPSFPRHPLALAAQALTLQAVTGAPVDLGIGVSHRHVVEGQHGIPFDRPLRHLREYLQVLAPLLRGEEVDFHGEALTAVGSVGAPGARPPSVLVGSLGPESLRITGAHADGVIAIWAGARALGEYVVPTLLGAADGPRRVVTAQLISVTDDPDGVRGTIADTFAPARDVPAYRALFDRDGVDGPGDTVIAGDEEAVLDAVRGLEDVGATELLVMPVGSDEERARTRALFRR